MPGCEKAQLIPFRRSNGMVYTYTRGLGIGQDCDPLIAHLQPDSGSGLVKPTICRGEFSDGGSAYRSADGMTRLFVTAPDTIGACCFPGGFCNETTPQGCAEQGGRYFFPGRACDDVDCECDCPQPEERWPAQLLLTVEQISWQTAWYNYCDVGAYSCPGCPGEEPAIVTPYTHRRGGFQVVLDRGLYECRKATYGGTIYGVFPLHDIYSLDQVYRCRPFDVCPLACCRKNIQTVMDAYSFSFGFSVSGGESPGQIGSLDMTEEVFFCGSTPGVDAFVPSGINAHGYYFEDGYEISSPAVPPYCTAIDREIPILDPTCGYPIRWQDHESGTYGPAITTYVSTGNCRDWISGFNSPLEGGYITSPVHFQAGIMPYHASRFTLSVLGG